MSLAAWTIKTRLVVKNKHIRRFVIVLTLPFLIALNCVFITISAIKQMVVTNVKTVKSAIEQGV